MITTLIRNETQITIKGPVGQLEMIVHQHAKKAPWGIVCHPHPVHGGTMHNKVVTTLVKTFQDLGLNTIRFNFRGVGKSTGKFNKGVGELDDLIAVINWVQQSQKEYDIWLGGFSFGAFIAIKAATKIPLTKLVTVAPPVSYFANKKIPAITCPWVLVQGDKDEVVPAQKVYKWAAKREPKPTILRFPEAGHFFHGQLVAMRTQLLAALR